MKFFYRTALSSRISTIIMNFIYSTTQPKKEEGEAAEKEQSLKHVREKNAYFPH
jgi:hypothetical protein